MSFTTSQSVWATGTNAYARRRQLLTGSIEARDLRVGDEILIRVWGNEHRSIQRIQYIHGDGRDVVMTFYSGQTHRTSRDMKVALA